MQVGGTVSATRSAGRCSCSCCTCLHHLDEGVGTRMQGSLGWLLLLDAAHRAHSPIQCSHLVTHFSHLMWAATSCELRTVHEAAPHRSYCAFAFQARRFPMLRFSCRIEVLEFASVKHISWKHIIAQEVNLAMWSALRHTLGFSS